MSPTAARSSRSSLHHPRSSSTPTSATTSSVYHQQQQQQQILYAPVSNPMVTLPPCGTAFQSSYVYPNVQPTVSLPNSIPVHLQGKSNRWHSKNKTSRGQQYYQQQQLPYNQKPVMLLDQSSTNVAPIPPPTTSFLVAASTFTHGPLPTGEHYNSATGATTHLLPQSYFKPPDMQTFCLIQDRPNLQQQQQQQQQHPMTSYYNISATNTCSLQTVNANSSFPLTNLGPYTSLASFANNQFPTSMQSSPLFSNPSVGLVFAQSTRDKPLPLPTLEFSFKHNASKVASVCESRVLPIGRDENSDCWSSQFESSSNNPYNVQVANSSKSLDLADCSSLRKVALSVAKTDEEHYSDESSTSFDFTIEAEKMVSALCNTTSSNDLGKEESRSGKTDSAPLFSGAGDNAPNKTAWFTDLCSEYENGTSIGVQTEDPCTDRSQYPELIRKTAYWGCTEAEAVLERCESLQTDSKRSWLTCLSSATRTAITKSSTCIPVFAGDRVFADDLINALLRISNGWLSLDNYLNKQHSPNLLDRLEPEFVACFHAWEESTCELLRQMVRTFCKFGESDETIDAEQRHKEACGSSSFPGDVSLYAGRDPLAQSSPVITSSQRDATTGRMSSQENPRSAASTSSLYNFQYHSSQQEQSASHKESKLRSKWTITESPSAAINTTKSVPNVSVCHTDASGPTSNGPRAKDASTSKRHESAQKSLNAEFCQLRNKVMEDSAGATKHARKRDRTPENKSVTSRNSAECARLQNAATSSPVSYRGLYTQNCMAFAFPLSGQPDSSYPSPGSLTYGGAGYPLSEPYPTTDPGFRSNESPEQIYGVKAASANVGVCVGRSQVDQMEFPAVPRNKVTLLSQIEPRTFDKESEEMAANLSAWFASMRNAQLPVTVLPTLEGGARTGENSAQRLLPQQEMPKYSLSGVIGQSQIDANRQFQALRNLPNIQSTPWAAGNFMSGRFSSQQARQRAPEEYDSSEDVRVYMKPGSYNVPKKRHQRRQNRRQENGNATTSRNASNYHSACGGGGRAKNVSSTPVSHAPTPATNVGNATLIKTSFPAAAQLPAPLFNLENSPRILKRTESLSRSRQDVTWKAACASAEILLEALNVKDCADASEGAAADRDDAAIRRADPSTSASDDDAEALPTTSRRSDPKSTKRDDVDCVSSYEASDDENSDSTCRLSPSASIVSVSQTCENENALGIKTNVKTDSWLIKTLNNASIVSKRKRREDGDADRRDSGSSNSSEFARAKRDRPASSIANANTETPATIVDSEYPAIFSRERAPCSSFPRNRATSTKESTEAPAGRATYSETVRRSMRSDGKEESRGAIDSATAGSSTASPIPGRKCQRRDPEQSYQLLQHKSRKSTNGRRVERSADNDPRPEVGTCANVGGVRSNATAKPSTAVRTAAHGRKDSERAEGKCAGKPADRGWSVWYSSRRKQGLGPPAYSKLEAINRAIWRMDEAKIFKIPLSCGDKDGQSPPAGMIEDYCKVVKSPIFLEIIDYKLKNRAYHKVEHAVKDFRRIIHNARLYQQHDDERTRKIDAVSRKLEDLLEEHFGNWDLDNVAGSPREDLSVQLRSKAPGHKPIATRYDSAKRSASSLLVPENSSLH